LNQVSLARIGNLPAKSQRKEATQLQQRKALGLYHHQNLA
jgi:hypothetical protein